MASALELLNPAEKREIPLLSQYFGPIACGFIGFGTALFVNFANRRPVVSGIHKHFLFTAIGAGLGWWLEDTRNNYLAKKDAMFRHYIELHPEDFPAPVRQKYSEVLQPWVPVR